MLCARNIFQVTQCDLERQSVDIVNGEVFDLTASGWE